MIAESASHLHVWCKFRSNNVLNSQIMKIFIIIIIIIIIIIVVAT
jgi:hypothetical protein